MSPDPRYVTYLTSIMAGAYGAFLLQSMIFGKVAEPTIAAALIGMGAILAAAVVVFSRDLQKPAKYVIVGVIFGFIFGSSAFCNMHSTRNVCASQIPTQIRSMLRIINKPEIVLLLMLTGYILITRKDGEKSSKSSKIFIKSVSKDALMDLLPPSAEVLDVFIVFSDEFARTKGKNAKRICIDDVISNIKSTEKYGSLLVAVFDANQYTPEDIRKELLRYGIQIAAAIVFTFKDPYSGKTRTVLIDNSEFHPKGLKKKAKLWKEGVKLSDVIWLIEH